PTGLREKPAGIIRIFLTRLLAGHFDIPAEQDRREPEIRFTLAEAKQARAEAEAEGLHANIEQPCGPIMPELVDQYHDPDENQQPPNVLQENHRIKTLR